MEALVLWAAGVLMTGYISVRIVNGCEKYSHYSRATAIVLFTLLNAITGFWFIKFHL
ncbi:hypothetical protein [Paenibacillus alkalitolerans]|uniref:hypothetical protein n=1 Tax=Paenibacillus alkalitolerans TaxID=2799335 RepID=UPI0018F77025|nr:hypothetical protein [Paenibacillus alkalitolerans]